MKVKLYNRIIFAILFLAHFGSAQNIAFKGGDGDGFTRNSVDIEFLDFTKGNEGDGFSFVDFISTESNFTLGGNGDGHTNVEFQQQFLDYSKGGLADGFTKAETTNSFNDMYVGDIGDGFTKVETTNNFNDMYVGNVGDGFTKVETSDGFNDMYIGGQSDGFSFDKYGHIIFWTGAVSTGWNVSQNWANNIIPSYCNPVVIPSGVPNFPAVNAGLLRIGYYTNQGDYRCQRLKINSGAEMLTRTNCYIENYDLVFIQGKLFVKNPVSNAFSNLGEGTILLKPSAELNVKE